MAYGDFKDLPRRTVSDIVLRDKAFNIAGNSKYHGCQRGLSRKVYNFLKKVIWWFCFTCTVIDLSYAR